MVRLMMLIVLGGAVLSSAAFGEDSAKDGTFFDVLVLLQDQEASSLGKEEIESLQITKKNKQRLHTLVYRAYVSRPALNLLGTIQTNAQLSQNIRYDGENLALGYMFFQVTAAGKAALEKMPSVRRVYRSGRPTAQTDP